MRSPFLAMPTGTVFTFLGFPGWAPLHLWLPRNEDPRAAARVLSEAVTERGAAALGAVGLLSGFLRSVRQGQPVAWPVPGAGCAYRYLIVYREGGQRPLRISAWCLNGEGPGWIRQCEPMPLERFLKRFAPRRLPRAGEAPGAGLA